MVRKFTKSKAVFPTDDSIKKVIFMSVKEISKKWTTVCEMDKGVLKEMKG